jgi:putative ABC transport system permease protein
MLHYPSDNKIIEGREWNNNDAGKLLVSLESKLASELHIKIGDQLGFTIGDRSLDATVSNIRSVDWSSFHPNFYVIFPPASLDAFSATYISSFHLGRNQTGVLNQVIKEYPNVTIIDIAGTLRQMQSLLTKAGTALQYLFSFSVCAAVLIFITSLISSMDERRATYRLLRVLGASRRYIISSLFVEFSVLALLTLIFSYTLATVISRLLIMAIF